MHRFALLCLFIGLALPAAGDNDRAGDFDYYVLALSWSPTWCAIEGDARNAPQCDASRDLGWVLHGLCPQYRQGWPAYCQSPYQQPSRAMTGHMADIMGTGSLALYQWKKHGSCAGLPPEQYFAQARRAYDAVTRPEVFRHLDKTVRLPAAVVERAFLEANPTLEPDMLTITCREGRIQEARLCLSKALRPVHCGRDIAQDCKLGDALFSPIR
jgi:ribonuclease T2